MSFPLSSMPSALGHFDGSLRKTNKSMLLKCLEKLAPAGLQTLDRQSGVMTSLLVDGMTLNH